MLPSCLLNERYSNRMRSIGFLVALVAVLVFGLVFSGFATPARAEVRDLLADIGTVNQHDLGGPEAANACGQAAAKMVLDYWQLQRDPSIKATLTISEVATYVWQHYEGGRPIGTDRLEIEGGIEELSRDPQSGYGFPLNVTFRTTSAGRWLTDLKSELDEGRPIIVFLPDGGRLWKNPDGTQRFKYPHWIVVSGYAADDAIIYHDPYDGSVHAPIAPAVFGQAWGTRAGHVFATWQYLTVIPVGQPVGSAPMTTIPPAAASPSQSLVTQPVMARPQTKGLSVDILRPLRLPLLGLFPRPESGCTGTLGTQTSGCHMSADRL